MKSDIERPRANIRIASRKSGTSLRDIAAQRLKLTPPKPDHLEFLLELGYVEMRDDTSAFGHRILTWPAETGPR